MSATLSLRGGEAVEVIPLTTLPREGFGFLAERLGLCHPERTGLVRVWSDRRPFVPEVEYRPPAPPPRHRAASEDEKLYLHELHAELLNLFRNSPTRGLVLFTSRRHMYGVADALKESLGPDLQVEPRPRLCVRNPGEPAQRAVDLYRGRDAR